MIPAARPQLGRDIVGCSDASLPLVVSTQPVEAAASAAGSPALVQRVAASPPEAAGAAEAVRPVKYVAIAEERAKLELLVVSRPVLLGGPLSQMEKEVRRYGESR